MNGSSIRSAGRKLAPLAPLAISLVLLTSACGRNKVSHSNIEKWISLEGGEKKLEKAVTGNHGPELRGHAVAALCASTRIGPSLAESAAAKVSPEARAAVMAEASRRLMEKASVPADAALQAPEVAAKDCLALLRKHSSPDDQTKIDAFLASWLLANPPKRWTVGMTSGDRVFEELGSGAADELVKALGAGTVAVKETAKALGRVGSPEQRMAAVKGILAAHDKKGGIPSDETLLAVGSLGGDDAVAWLHEFAKDPDEELRFKAIQALAMGSDRKALRPTLDTMVKHAANQIETGRVRDEAFGVIQSIGGADALAAMQTAKIFADPKEVVRFEAYEVALRGSQELAIQPVLEAIPTSGSYPEGVIEQSLIRFIRPIGSKALEPLRGSLSSKNWVARLVAIEALADMGDKSDAARVEALKKDVTKLRGWAGEATIASRAQIAADKLKTKP